jgi:hypothetical protein
MNELHRDSETNRIISYIDEREVKNKGMIEIPVVDQRFLSDDFNFIVKSKFSSLPDAINAEQTIFNQLNVIQSGLLSGIPLSNLTDENIRSIQDIAKNELLQNLQNIVESNPNSIASLEKKIAELESIVDNQREQLVDWQVASEKWQETVSLWALENENQSVRADAFERLSNQLSAQNEQIITELKTEMDLQNIIASGSISSLAQRTDKTLNTLLTEVDNIRTVGGMFTDPATGYVGKLSEKINVDFLNESPPEENGGADETGG